MDRPVNSARERRPEGDQFRIDRFIGGKMEGVGDVLAEDEAEALPQAVDGLAAGRRSEPETRRHRFTGFIAGGFRIEKGTQLLKESGPSRGGVICCKLFDTGGQHREGPLLFEVPFGGGRIDRLLLIEVFGLPGVEGQVFSAAAPLFTPRCLAGILEVVLENGEEEIPQTSQGRIRRGKEVFLKNMGEKILG